MSIQAPLFFFPGLRRPEQRDAVRCASPWSGARVRGPVRESVVAFKLNTCMSITSNIARLGVPTAIGLLFLSACSSKPDVGDSASAREAGLYAQGDTISVNGLLVDTRCFAANRQNLGMDHPDPVPTSQTGPACARYCALQGFPVGVAVDGPEGPVWILLSSPQVLADYMEQTVRVRGVVRSEGVLTPQRVEMQTTDGGWTFIL